MSQKPDNKGQEPKADDGQQVQVTNAITGQQQNSQVIKKTDKFYRGVWANRQNENEPNKVVLEVNGEAIQWQRGVECIVPEAYLEVAKNATHDTFTVKPGEGRQKVGKVTRFPFSVISSSNYEEFRKMFLEGTHIQRQAVAAHGLNIPVAKAVPQLD